MLPKTYNFKEREEVWQKFWEKEKIYRFDENSQKPIFCVDTPPPYVSAAHLHLGHVMSYPQAEFIVRFKRMQGFNVFYPMGFDDNGLPTERFVEKKYKIDKSKISRREFVKLCLKETKLGAKNYKKFWQALGISSDWTKTYSTINKHCQKISQWSFLDLYKKKKLERLEGPIYWCPFCQTALAQADLEDKEEEGNLYYIQFKTKKGKTLLIATTRPELLGACVALYFNPQDKRYAHLKGKVAIVPLFNYTVPILTDPSVDKDFGTGLMMVCTWGDKDDVVKCKKNKLATRVLFDEQGKLTKLAGPYQGLSILEARNRILADLKKQGLLKKQEKISHTLNVHERCERPAEFIQTKQWFVKLLDIKKKLLERGRQLKWYPSYMQKKYENWVKALQWDWCISRQRYYGVPFPLWYCQKCDEVILAKEKNLPVDPTENTPPLKTCPKCGSKKFKPEKDVMDTWMTSSMTPLIGAGLVKNKTLQKKLYPATLRPQAFEIIRTWLFYTVVKSHYHHNSLPFYDVVISGLAVDSKGRKISKRLGNYIIPENIIEKYGADALRYWPTRATLGENLRYSEDEVKKGKRTVIKIFNASRFALAHLLISDINTSVDIGYQQTSLESADKWVLHHLFQTIEQATKYLETYEYSKAREVVDQFFWHIFCDNYLEFIKHRLYGNPNSTSAKTAKKVLYILLLDVLKLYAPFLPFITEEIYQSYFRKIEKFKSIHLSPWPKAQKSWLGAQKFLKSFEKVLNLIEDIRKYKSEKNISLGEEIDEFRAPEKIDPKYIDFVQKATRVKKIMRV